MRTCSVAGCGAPHHAKGMCSTHYHAAWIPTYERKCSIPGCGRPHAAHGLCVPHWKRNRRYGTPLANCPVGRTA